MNGIHRPPARFPKVRALILSAVLVLSACRGEREPASLKEVFRGRFLVGAALNEEQFAGRTRDETALVIRQFNAVTPENVLKWEVVHPAPDSFYFAPADTFVHFGEERGMFVVGHTLIWHHQTPSWVFENENGAPTDRETLLARMRDHIHAVVGRYRGRVDGWDVVNEALNDDGTLRETPWQQIIGNDYIVRAFEYAREADPYAELYYNDYWLAAGPKRAGAVRLVKDLLDGGAEVDGVGIQGHWNLEFPDVAALDSTIEAFGALGAEVMITELDVDVLPAAWPYRGADLTLDAALRDSLNPYRDALPDSMQRALAERYADLFRVFVARTDRISRVTFWGVTDRTSWLNDWPVAGRTSYPLLFGRDGRAKPAFSAVASVGG